LFFGIISTCWSSPDFVQPSQSVVRDEKSQVHCGGA
jgi:hypothetical protein